MHRLPRTDMFRPLSESGVRAPMLKKARAAALTGATTVLTENFDKCTAGSEASPASEGIAGEIPASWTSTPGWVGATVHQAGGCLFVDSWQTTSNGQPVTTYLLDTPKVGGSAFGALRITFRARTASGSMPLYVINANGNTSTSPRHRPKSAPHGANTRYGSPTPSRPPSSNSRPTRALSTSTTSRWRQSRS